MLLLSFAFWESEDGHISTFWPLLSGHLKIPRPSKDSWEPPLRILPPSGFLGPLRMGSLRPHPASCSRAATSLLLNTFRLIHVGTLLCMRFIMTRVVTSGEGRVDVGAVLLRKLGVDLQLLRDLQRTLCGFGGCST